MVRLSIIIPAVGSQRDLEDTLVSVLSNRPQHCEVLVVFAGPYEDPYDLGDEVRFVEADALSDVTALANAGIAASQGHAFHLLSAGTEVADGWTELPMRWFAQDSAVAAVSPLIVAAGDRHRVVAAGVRYRLGGRRQLVGCGASVPKMSTYRGPIDGPTLSAGFYRRTAVVSAGGFDPFVGPRLADVDLAMNLQQLGYRCVFEPGCLLSGRRETPAARCDGFRQGRFAERLFWRHRRRAGWLHAMGSHAVEVVVSGLSRLPRPSSVTSLAGRLLALWDVAGGAPRRCVSTGDQAGSYLIQARCQRGQIPLREAG